MSDPPPDIFELLTRGGSEAGARPRPPIGETAANVLGRVPASVPSSVTDLDGKPRAIDMGPLIARDPHPIPADREREDYCTADDAGYWVSGLRDYLKVRQAVERHATRPSTRPRILDFGCASGRVLRHYACQEPEAEVWGCDIDRRNVDWIARFLPGRVRAFQNTVFPNLPLADGSFDVVSAFSVFTHVDALEDAWILELRRLLRAGGVAVITFHSERSWKRVPRMRWVLDAMKRCQAATPEWTIDAPLFERPMPADRIVFRWATSGSYRCNTFHSMDHVRGRWGRFFASCHVYDGGDDGFQDLAVLVRE
jgi:SAM-dependent methyltransferase